MSRSSTDPGAEVCSRTKRGSRGANVCVLGDVLEPEPEDQRRGLLAPPVGGVDRANQIQRRDHDVERGDFQVADLYRISQARDILRRQWRQQPDRRRIRRSSAPIPLRSDSHWRTETRRTEMIDRPEDPGQRQGDRARVTHQEKSPGDARLGEVIVVGRPLRGADAPVDSLVRPGSARTRSRIRRVSAEVTSCRHRRSAGSRRRLEARAPGRSRMSWAASSFLQNEDGRRLEVRNRVRRRLRSQCRVRLGNRLRQDHVQVVVARIIVRLVRGRLVLRLRGAVRPATGSTVRAAGVRTVRVRRRVGLVEDLSSHDGDHPIGKDQTA